MLDYEPNPSLLCVARAGAGYNNIPVDDYAAKGVVVFNTPGANANAVKELAVCALILASRDVVGGIEWCKTIADKGDEVAALVEKGKANFVGPELMGKTLGLIGLGNVGAKVANAAAALGMTVLGYDPYLSDALRQQLKGIAEATGAKYFAVNDEKALSEALEEIDRMEKTTVESVAYERYKEHFAPFLVGGALLVLAAVSVKFGLRC